jgi:hypothetical protein
MLLHQVPQSFQDQRHQPPLCQRHLVNLCPQQYPQRQAFLFLKPHLFQRQVIRQHPRPYLHQHYLKHRQQVSYQSQLQPFLQPQPLRHQCRVIHPLIQPLTLTRYQQQPLPLQSRCLLPSLLLQSMRQFQPLLLPLLQNS